MSRKVHLRRQYPDEDFQPNTILTRLFIEKILKNGKKNLATKILEKSLLFLKNKTKKNPFYLLEKAVRKVSPFGKIVSEKTDGEEVKEKPMIFTQYQSVLYAINFLIESAKKKREKNFINNLAYEIFDASQGRGDSIKKRDEMHFLLYDFIDSKTKKLRIPTDEDNVKLHTDGANEDLESSNGSRKYDSVDTTAFELNKVTSFKNNQRSNRKKQQTNKIKLYGKR